MSKDHNEGKIQYGDGGGCPDGMRLRHQYLPDQYFKLSVILKICFDYNTSD